MAEVSHRRMRPDDRDALLDLLEHAFGERELFARYMDLFPEFKHEDFLLACRDDRPVSCVQIFDMRVRLGAGEILLGGIGSVATYEQHRGHGLAGTLMRQATDEMQRRGSPLALLFAGPIPFYEALGWHSIPRRLLLLSELPDPRPAAGRVYQPADLPAVRALYDAFNRERPLTTIRDEAYWHGQLQYAGNPGEDFRVFERDGQIVAYSRVVELEAHVVMEFARRPDAAAELAALLVAQAPQAQALTLPDLADAELEAALARADARAGPLEFPSPMFRVLDAPALAGLAGLPADTEERQLLARLVEPPGAMYWLSDRF